LTRTVPTPGTLLALIVTADAEDALDGAELAGLELGPEPEAVVDDDPQAATVAAAPRTTLPYSRRRPNG
jgi:hypothetical protein